MYTSKLYEYHDFLYSCLAKKTKKRFPDNKYTILIDFILFNFQLSLKFKPFPTMESSSQKLESQSLWSVQSPEDSQHLKFHGTEENER